MDEEKTAKLSYAQIDALETAAKKYTGNHHEKWVDSKSLCTTYQHAHIYRQESTNRRVIKCQELSRYVPEDITECNAYLNFTQLSLSQMSQLATLIGGLPERKVGFRQEMIANHPTLSQEDL